MFGEVSALQPIDKLSAHSGATPQPPPRGSPAPAGSVSDPLAEPPGTRSDTATARSLSALVSTAPARILRRRPARQVLPFGILLYLASVGIVASATVGVLFGIGFSLLVKPTEAMSAGAPTPGHGSVVGSLLSSIVPHFFRETAAADSEVMAAPGKPGVPRLTAVAILPAAPVPRRSPADQTVSPGTSIGVLPAAVGNAFGSDPGAAPAEGAEQPIEARGTASASPVLALEPPPATTIPAVIPAPAGVPTGAVAELLARGDNYLLAGDIASARLFYERAADAGSGQGAMRLGATFDPNFLRRTGLVGNRGDQTRADMWYRRGRELGAAEAAQEARGPK